MAQYDDDDDDDDGGDDDDDDDDLNGQLHPLFFRVTSMALGQSYDCQCRHAAKLNPWEQTAIISNNLYLMYQMM